MEKTGNFFSGDKNGVSFQLQHSQGSSITLQGCKPARQPRPPWRGSGGLLPSFLFSDGRKVEGENKFFFPGQSRELVVILRNKEPLHLPAK